MHRFAEYNALLSASFQPTQRPSVQPCFLYFLEAKHQKCTPYLTNIQLSWLLEHYQSPRIDSFDEESLTASKLLSNT